MTKRNEWFRVDKEGLAQVYARRGPAAPFFELISNAWDEEGVDLVELTVTAVTGKAEVEVCCEDNSTRGFENLEEARVLFAPSKKKSDAEQRGRFNVGEKLFLSLCTQATISSTGGQFVFQPDGKVRRTSRTRPRGTMVEAVMRMTRVDAMEAFEELGNIISPEGVDTLITFVGFAGDAESEWKHERFAAGAGLLAFRAKLQSELSDEDGALRPTERTTDVHVWKLSANEQRDRYGILFEMGIPVRELDGPFDVNVMQKVPLTVDRDNVRPAFLRRLRAELLNHAWRHVTTKAEANAAWVTEAMGSTSPVPLPEALEAILDLRFGAKRVAYDPSDREGSQIAMSQGYTVVHGGSLPAAVWDNVKPTGALKPAGQVTPSKSDKVAPAKMVDPASVEGGVEVIAIYKRLAKLLIGEAVQVVILEADADVLADYGNRKIRLNLQRLGRAWFRTVRDNGGVDEKHVELLVHELGHEFSSSHLDVGFHRSQTRLGVKLAFLAQEFGNQDDIFEVIE